MRPATVFKIVLVAALLLAVAAIAAAKSVNTERYKAVMIERVRAATGLTLVFAGPVKLRLGLAPRLSVTGLGLSVPGATPEDPPLLFVDRVEARVGLLPLLFHQFRTERLVLIRPTLHLTPATAPAAAAAMAAATGTGALALDRVGDEVPSTRFALGEVDLKDGVLRWLSGPDRPETRVALAKGRIRPESIEGGPMTLEATGSWSGTDFEIDGIVGPAPARKGQRPFPVRLKGTISGTVVVARGGIADPVAGEGLDLELDARGDELRDLLLRAGLIHAGGNPAGLAVGPYKISARLTGSARAPVLTNVDLLIGKHDTLLVKARGSVAAPLDPASIDLAVTAEADSLTGPGRLLGLDLPGSGPVRLTTRLTDDGPGRWRLAGIKVQIGDSDLGGDLVLRLAERPRLSGKLSATTLAPADFGLDPARLLDSAAPSRPAVAIDDDRLLPNDPLALDPLGAVDLDLALNAARLPLGAITLSDAAATLLLADGHLSLSGLTARLGDGTISGGAGIDSSERVPVVSLHLTGSGLDLTQIGSGFPFEKGHAEFSLDLRGRGATPRLLAASLDGTLQASLTETGLLASTAGGVPARLLTALDSGTGDEDPIALRCVALRLGVKDGVARAEKGIAVETPRTAILGSGSLDLRTEALDLTFAARGGGLIRLRGDLATPQVGADTTPPRPSTPRTATSKMVVDATPCRAVLGRH